MKTLNDFNPNEVYTAKVKKTERLTPSDLDEIREITLEIKDFNCQVNQSFGVLTEGRTNFGTHLHHRMYSIADIPNTNKGSTTIKMLVKRCFYVDDFSGERYPGIASNYLCDRQKGDEIKITGPYEVPFTVPDDKSANLLLIGMGTGIAPFRAFIKHVYTDLKDWQGKIRLFYGAKSGLELLYLNEKDGDLTNYYDENTFKAFSALSPRPHWADPIALDKAMEEQADEIRELLAMSNTYIYVAGYDKIKPALNAAMANILGSAEKWKLRKAELIAGKKWAEIVY